MLTKEPACGVVHVLESRVCNYGLRRVCVFRFPLMVPARREERGTAPVETRASIRHQHPVVFAHLVRVQHACMLLVLFSNTHIRDRVTSGSEPPQTPA